MPANYQAESPSLFGNPGGPMAPRYTVDVPGAIDALANGTSSVIHNIYMRKQAQATQQLEKAHWDQQAAWHADEVERQRARDAMEAERWSREQHLKELTSGVTPGTTTTAPVPAAPGQLAPVAPSAQPAAQPSSAPIHAAMGAPAPFDPSGATASPLPTVQQTPSGAAPQPSMPVPQSDFQTTTTPEEYDPTKSAAYVRTTETAKIRGETMRELATQRAAAAQAGREYMAGEALKRLRIAIQGRKDAKGGNIGKAMTGNVAEKAREQAAIGLIDRTNGSYDDAAALLNADTPEAKGWRDLGVESRHLMYGHAQYVKGTVGAATRLQAGALGMTPKESVGAVKETRELVGGKKEPPAAPPASGEPTDAELDAAIAAGVKPTDAAGLRAFAKKSRTRTK